MIKISVKIWMLANLMVFAIFAVSLFPNGFGYGAEALMYSSLFSAPAVLSSYLLLRLLKFLNSTTAFSWIMFMLSTGLIAYASYYSFDHLLGSDWRELDFILPLSLISGYAAVLSHFSSLHELFQQFQYENETNHY